MPSNIRAFVHFKDQAVFAGEDVECVITFKNTAKRQNETGKGSSRNGVLGDNSRQKVGGRSRTNTESTTRPAFSKVTSLGSPRHASYGKGHRPTLSLSVVPNTSPHARTASGGSATPSSAIRPARKHGRSLSILSPNSNSPSAGGSRRTQTSSSRRGNGHGRSASMQVIPRMSSQASTPIGGSHMAIYPSHNN